jgi:60 kDa SS-A/Ro ribonucleoprotein
MRAWAELKARCPAAKLVCVDLQPTPSAQTVERTDVLHVGGFSDAVFERIAAFAGGDAGASEAARWQARVEAVPL